jgi:WD40 repeat protein
MSHRSPITCIDHHTGSDRTVTGGYDGRVVGWARDEAGRWQAQWSADFDDLVNDVRIDPTGTSVAVAVADRFAVVLDMAHGERTQIFGPHGDDVNAVRWSPDGSQLACVMDHLDTTVRIWPVRGGAATTLDGHESGVFAVAFDPAGTRVATVAEDATARIWDLATGEQVHVLKHPGDPEALDWSSDGSVVMTGCDDGVARVWDPETGDLVRELDDAHAAVRFIRFDATGAWVLVGAYDARMRQYDTADWTVRESFARPFQWERSGAFTDRGVLIGSFGAAPVEHPPAPLAEVPLTYGINSVAAAPSLLLAGRDDGGVVDVLRGSVLARHDTIVNTVSISPDRRLVASGDYRGGVRITRLDATDDQGDIATITDDGGPVNSIAWHPSGTHFFSGGYDGRVRRWSLDGTCTASFVAHPGPIKSLAWSAAADLLVAGSSDGSLSGWRGDIEVWRSRASDLVLVNSVACADEAGWVVTASRDLRVRVWDAHTGELVQTLPAAHLKSVKAIAIVPDGSLMVTGSYDGTAIVWHRDPSGSGASAWRWQPLRLHGKPGVPSVAIADGNVFSAGWNGTIGRWATDGRLTAEYLVDRIV